MDEPIQFEDEDEQMFWEVVYLKLFPVLAAQPLRLNATGQTVTEVATEGADKALLSWRKRMKGKGRN